ncbi:hypothetical protein Tco_0979413 [Tanacetum coccineum]
MPARPMSYLLLKGKKFNTARPKAVVNAVKGNNFNVVKVLACWVWKPKNKVLDHVSKHNSASITLKKLIILMHKADPTKENVDDDEKAVWHGIEFIQFWSTVIGTTINGEEQLHARVDDKEIIITESSIRRDLQLADEEVSKSKDNCLELV